MCDLYAGSKGSRSSGLLIQYVGWHWKPFSVVWQIPDEVSQNDWSSPQSPFCRNILAMSPGCGLVMKTFVFNSPQWTSLPWIHPIAFWATREFTFHGKVSHSSAVRCTRKDALCWFRSAGFMWCSLSHSLEETSGGCCLFSFPFSHCLLQLFSLLFARGDSRLSSRSTSPSWNQAKAQNQARFSCSRCAMDSVAEGCVCCKLKWTKLMEWGTQHFRQRIAKAVHQMQLASTSNPRPEKKKHL